jgi:hypothetical protein
MHNFLFKKLYNIVIMNIIKSFALNHRNYRLRLKNTLSLIVFFNFSEKILK